MILTPDRRAHERPLDTLANIPRQALARLAALGVTTVAELRDLWAFGDRLKLLDYLGESPKDWFPSAQLLTGTFRTGTFRGGPATAGDPLSAAGLAPLRHPRGLLARDPAQPAPAPAPLGASPSPSAPGGGTDLRQRFPAIRDQGRRGTCVAFASAALFELHRYGGSEGAQRHSEQFLYWACKQNDGYPDVDGTFLETARGVLDAVGACLNATWPYADVSIPGNLGHHPPPPGAEVEAASHTWPLGQTINPKDPAGLRRILDEGRPVVVGVETFDGWDYPNATEYGEINMPLPNETRDGGHAVVLVGYELREGVPGGGRFIFRNSWGTDWAAHGHFGPGYGTLYFEYLRNHGLEAFA